MSDGSGDAKGKKLSERVSAPNLDDLDRLEQMEDSEGTVRQSGSFSEGFQNLTSMLKDDKFFQEISNSSNPSAASKMLHLCIGENLT